VVGCVPRFAGRSVRRCSRAQCSLNGSCDGTTLNHLPGRSRPGPADFCHDVQPGQPLGGGSLPSGEQLAGDARIYARFRRGKIDDDGELTCVGSFAELN